MRSFTFFQCAIEEVALVLQQHHNSQSQHESRSILKEYFLTLFRKTPRH